MDSKICWVSLSVCVIESQGISIGLLMVGVINKVNRIGEHPERRRLDYIKCHLLLCKNFIEKRLGSITTFPAVDAITKILQ